MRLVIFALLTLSFLLTMGVAQTTACICRDPFDQNTTTLEKLDWYRSRTQTLISGKVVGVKYLSRQISRATSISPGARKNIRVARFWGAPVQDKVFLDEGFS
jgi:hypothetical protein